MENEMVLNFNEEMQWLMFPTIGFIMFSIALGLKKEDFFTVFNTPKQSFVGLSSQLILLPLFVVLVCVLFKPTAGLALGIILIASCPGGNISNFATFVSGGNAALSITLTTAVTLLASLITPFNLLVYGNLFPGSRELLQSVSVDPFYIAKSIFLSLLVPLLIGMIIRSRFESLAIKALKPFRIASLIILFSFIYFGVAENVEVIFSSMTTILPIVVIINLSAYLLGYKWAALFKLNVADRKAIAFETGIQNSGLAIIISIAFFPHIPEMAIAAAWWSIWDIASALILAYYWRWRFVTKN